jgi:antitoxin MazE
LIKLEKSMEIEILNIGQGKGVVLPKHSLAQAGLEGQTTANIAVENGSIVLRKTARAVRAGWSEAARVVASKGGDALLMGEFHNAGDSELIW